MWRRKPSNLQTKVVLVLVCVIVPTYLLLTIIQNQLTQPMLQQDLRQLGVSVGEALAAHVASNRLLTRPDASVEIERAILERLYLQPSIVRMEVYERQGDVLKLVASNVDEEPTATKIIPYVDKIETTMAQEDDLNYWRILVPIQAVSPNRRSPGRVIGLVNVWVSTRAVERILDRIWKITGVGAVISILLLVFLLSYFLRKTIANEQRLRKTEDANQMLMEQLHETQRKMMNTEKLAVMGQLTANFAHEIGTPLNAIGGHLQLLKEDLHKEAGKENRNAAQTRLQRRLDIISGELTRIEGIVKGFLQTTTKPDSQRQLVDLNLLLDKTLDIVRPRVDSLEVELQKKLDRKMGPLRIVPSDIEQIFLNILNNALDSLKEKKGLHNSGRLQLKVFSEVHRDKGEDWLCLGVHDTGVGIAKTHLKNVAKPFFTTKAPGEGTGLGLAICRQLIAKYGGRLEIDSKEGAWAECRLEIPYRSNV